ncbi:hypothetical protein Zmor_024783 [Zophobas morio]|uniref:Uncharacterized protein n=1 Tax=Zophobas morio TaxID=2755281 RepID=A0AA38M8D1_9CUCU|nr:hypothetical protein Zmor_024783 [Zophobas morio]
MDLVYSPRVCHACQDPLRIGRELDVRKIIKAEDIIFSAHFNTGKFNSQGPSDGAVHFFIRYLISGRLKRTKFPKTTRKTGEDTLKFLIES